MRKVAYYTIFTHMEWSFSDFTSIFNCDCHFRNCSVCMVHRMKDTRLTGLPLMNIKPEIKMNCEEVLKQLWHFLSICFLRVWEIYSVWGFCAYPEIKSCGRSWLQSYRKWKWNKNWRSFNASFTAHALSVARKMCVWALNFDVKWGATK